MVCQNILPISFKRSRKIYEKANEYNEDAFRLNVPKNRFKTFEQLDHDQV